MAEKCILKVGAKAFMPKWASDCRYRSHITVPVMKVAESAVIVTARRAFTLRDRPVVDVQVRLSPKSVSEYRCTCAVVFGSPPTEDKRPEVAIGTHDIVADIGGGPCSSHPQW